MKRKFNLFLIIVLVFFSSTATQLFAAQTTTTYTYDNLNRLKVVVDNQSGSTPLSTNMMMQVILRIK